MLRGIFEKNMYEPSTIFEQFRQYSFTYHKRKKPFGQEVEIKIAAAEAAAAALLLTEGHAVGALIHGGVSLMGAHLDLFQGAVVGVVAVVSALGNSAGDALVGVTAHGSFLLLSLSALLCPEREK